MQHPTALPDATRATAPHVTHWTRILYRDWMMTDARDAASARASSGDARGLPRPTYAAALALGLYVAMYLGIGASVQWFTGPQSAPSAMPACEPSTAVTAAAPAGTMLASEQARDPHTDGSFNCTSNAALPPRHGRG
jgi:hypothetical protein